MILLDVNVLVAAHRADLPEHAHIKAYLDDVLNGPTAVGAPEHVLVAFLRIVTNRRIFRVATGMPTATAFLSALRAQDGWLAVTPTARTWETLERLLAATGVTGDEVPDAYLAALAISGGNELASGDRDFGRFPGLRWTNPLCRGIDPGGDKIGDLGPIDAIAVKASPSRPLEPRYDGV